MNVRLQAISPLLVSAYVFLFPPVTAPAQIESRTTGGGAIGGASVNANIPQNRKTVTVTLTALTPPRPWKNAESKVITAALLAHDRPEADKDKPPVVVKEGMIRLLKDKKIFNVALESLSREDQNYIEEIVYAIQEAEERKAKAQKKTKTNKGE